MDQNGRVVDFLSSSLNYVDRYFWRNDDNEVRDFENDEDSMAVWANEVAMPKSLLIKIMRALNDPIKLQDAYENVVDSTANNSFSAVASKLDQSFTGSGTTVGTLIVHMARVRQAMGYTGWPQITRPVFERFKKED